MFIHQDLGVALRCVTLRELLDLEFSIGIAATPANSRLDHKGKVE